MIENLLERTLLLDFYGELLTDTQREVFGDYIQEDLTVTEIGELRGISRQGAHDMIRRCEKILNEYENKLHLVEHYIRIKEMVSTIKQEADQIEKLCEKDADPAKIRKRTARIESLSTQILEMY